ncbi:MAG: amino acid adenylation domain-containing protein [Bacteroidetes bacterium]|nr:MAG: amino acid adenylation domain-containing protein [Bacteroidota bacterium]
MKLKDFNLLDDENDQNELLQLLDQFNNTSAQFPSKSIVTLWQEQVQQNPDRTALVFREKGYSYGEIEQHSNRLANLLIKEGIERNELIALLFEPSVEMITSILGVIKAGAAYLPLDPKNPSERLLFALNDSEARILIGQKRFTKQMNRLQWEAYTVKGIICTDSQNFLQESESQNELMKTELWDYISEKSHDDISGGGWFSSYTGEDIPRAEMDEYASNIQQKLHPYLKKDSRVLEIGCSFGISLFQFADQVNFYMGTDLSGVAIDHCRKLVSQKGLDNVQLQNLAAHEIDQLQEGNYDVIIMNSVIQLFHGHNYFRDVLRKCLSLMSDQGVLFLGDLQDLDKKAELIQSLKDFELENIGKGYQTKTDWSHELFLSRDFIEDLLLEFPEISTCSHSEKIHTLKNELTEFRFDSLLKIDKNASKKENHTAHKWQRDLRHIQESTDQAPDVRIEADDLLYVIYTSGSTGLPKGCLISHQNVVRLLFNDRLDFDFSEKDTWIMAHSYFFDFSVWEMYGALLYGGKLVLPTREEVRDLGRLLELVRKHRVSVLNQTPLSFQAFITHELEQTDRALAEHLRYVIFGGDKLEPEKLLSWKDKYPLDEIALINMYGITETTVHVTYHALSETDFESRGMSPIGRPLPETKIYVLNEQQQVQPIGIPGEMYIGGSGVCKGYLNRPELNQERFIVSPFDPSERLYRTGDLARWNENGTLDYLGRIDFQVKIRGYRIELGEVQNRLNEHPSVQECVVIAKEKQESKQLVAYYVSETALETEELRLFMSLKLPEYMIPAFFMKIDEIPLTSNGKLNKKALPDPWSSLFGEEQHFVEASNESEAILVELWSQILGMDRVSTEANFFHLGGDSLKAIRLVVEINKRFQSAIKVADVFKYQHLKEQAKLLHDSEAGDNREYLQGKHRIAEIKRYIEENNSLDLPESYEDIYPLSSIEKGMIFSSQLRPEEAVYYDQFTYHLHINSEEVFRQAFRLMVQKHENMRAAFYMSTFLEPVKVILSETSLPISFEDLSKLSPADQQKKINRYLEKDASERYRFEGDLLWKVKAFRLKAEHTYVVWSVHHSILDGWSESSFVTEFANLCARQDLLEIREIPKLKSSYQDYTALQLGRQASGEAEAYWKSLLADYERNKLPYNLSGTRISEELGMKRIGRGLSDTLSSKANELVDQMLISHKALHLSVYAFIMHILSGEQRVVAGCVSNDRPEIEDGDQILGCFLNTLPFSVDFRQISSVRDLILQMNTYLSEAKQHELYLLDVARSIGEKSSSGNPLFDCIFNFTDFHILEDIEEQNEQLSRASLSQMDWELRQNNLMTNTLFDVELDRTGGRLNLGIKYAKAYFTEKQIQNAIRLYELILDQFCEHLDLQLLQLELQSPAEKHFFENEFNATERETSKEALIHSAFEEQARRFPERIALIQNGHELNYGELDERANHLALQLKEYGVESGQKVAIQAPRNFDLIIALIAILKAGASYVPIDPAYPAERKKYILENSAAQTLINLCPEKLNLGDDQCLEIMLQDKDLIHQSKEKPAIQVGTEELAYTIYTSGSTGRPKGVMISHEAAVNLFRWVNECFEVNSDDRLLFITSVCFDLSVYDIFGILSSGAALVIATEDQIREPKTLIRLMQDEKISFWDAVPSTMNYLVDMIEILEPNFIQEELRLVFMSGDWIPVQLPEKINRFFPNAENISLGGATEGTIWSNYYKIPKDHGHQISIPYGKPIDNNRFYVLNEGQKIVPLGVPGELYIGGLGVAMGYANDPEKTAAAFFKDPFSEKAGARMYKTGDLGRIREDGQMEFLGRKDSQVKIRGYRVELGEVENQIQELQEVNRAVVIARETEKRNKELIAYIVWEKEASNLDEFRGRLRKKLPDYMIPAHFVTLQQLPLTSNGKVDRKSLPEVGIDRTNESHEAPHAGLEEKLSELWKSILNIDSIGRNDSVFDLGAHSLHAGAFVSRLYKQEELRISLRDLFAHPSIQMLATFLQESEQQEAFPELMKLKKQGFYPIPKEQQSLWLTDQQKQGKNQDLNFLINFKITGKMDLPRFQQAFNEVIQRHEILRTTFHAKDQAVIQQIHSEWKISISPEQAEDPEQWLLGHYKHSFQLGQLPLFKIRLLQISEEEHLLSFLVHNIIFDGWSMNVMMREILHYYEDEHQALPPLKYQFSDISDWLNRQAEHLSEQAANHWKKELSHPLPVLRMPSLEERPEQLREEANKVFQKIPSDLIQRLKNYCQEQQCTPYAFLHAINAILFRELSGQDDLIFGSIASYRRLHEMEEQIGYYYNKIPVRHQPKEEFTFAAYLQEVKRRLNANLEYDLYPFSNILEDINYQKNVNHGALFDVVLNMQNTSYTEANEEEIEQSGLHLQFLPNDQNLASFDYLMHFYLSDDLLITLKYRKQVVHQLLAENILRQIEHLMNLFLDQPQLLLSKVKLAPSHECTSTEFGTKAKTLASWLTGKMEKEIHPGVTFLEQGFGYKEVQQISQLIEEEHQVKLKTDQVLLLNCEKICKII